MTRLEGAAELPVDRVRGTLDALPADHARLEAIESSLLRSFALAGYRRLRTPVLERSELHERKSGVRIVSTLDKTAQDGVCLRPELTAGIVRAYAFADEEPPLPWRVSYAGPVFRRDEDGAERLREFHQVGVELIGAARPSADGETIWLADWALGRVGIPDATIRIGHVGLIREVLRSSGLPVSLQVALVELLSEAVRSEAEGGSSEDRVLSALDRHLDNLTGALKSGAEGEPPIGPSGGGAERLFASLYPNVVGRRSSREVVARLRRKWDLTHTLGDALKQVRAQIHELADLGGPATEILQRLERDFAASAPESVAALQALVGTLRQHGVDLDRVRLDLGFGRGIGFYSQMMFVLLVNTPEGEIEVCGGGRYDGLARELGSARDDRGVGFAFGLERLDDAIRLRQAKSASIEPAGYLVVPMDETTASLAIDEANRLRSAGEVAVFDSEAQPNSLALAESLGLAYVVVVGKAGSTRIEVASRSNEESTVEQVLKREGRRS